MLHRKCDRKQIKVGEIDLKAPLKVKGMTN